MDLWEALAQTTADEPRSLLVFSHLQPLEDSEGGSRLLPEHT